MPLTVRYTGSWLRFDIMGSIALGCVLSYAMVRVTENPTPGVWGPLLIGLWAFAVIWFVFAGEASIAVRRFRLHIGPDLISCRGAFGEKSYPREQVVRLATSPRTRASPGSLLFCNSAMRILLSVDLSLLSADQEAEISRFLNAPIERPGAG